MVSFGSRRGVAGGLALPLMVFAFVLVLLLKELIDRRHGAIRDDVHAQRLKERMERAVAELVRRPPVPVAPTPLVLPARRPPAPLVPVVVLVPALPVPPVQRPQPQPVRPRVAAASSSPLISPSGSSGGSSTRTRSST